MKYNKLKAASSTFTTEWVCRMPGPQADRLLVDFTADAMLSKLSKKRSDGKHGWHGALCDNAYLLASLKEHVEKGDMVDVINIAAMIHARTALFGETA